MDGDRVQRAISDDGTEIVGRVHGQGPPLVLVHGGLEDGDLCWASLVPHLCDRFTCYLMSTRGRGLSGDSRDVSPDRLVQDVVAFVQSIGEPVGLMGESSGGMWALGAAAHTPSVRALAAYEPVVFEALDEESAARLESTIARTRDAVAQGRLRDAARTFADALVNDDERAAISAGDYFEHSARYVPALLRETEAAGRAPEFSATDPRRLEQITAPLLLMYGERTAQRAWFAGGVRAVAEHVATAEVREMASLGHWAPIVRPEPLAGELVRFFEPRLAAA